MSDSTSSRGQSTELKLFDFAASAGWPQERVDELRVLHARLTELARSENTFASPEARRLTDRLRTARRELVMSANSGVLQAMILQDEEKLAALREARFTATGSRANGLDVGIELFTSGIEEMRARLLAVESHQELE